MKFYVWYIADADRYIQASAGEDQSERLLNFGWIYIGDL